MIGRNASLQSLLTMNFTSEVHTYELADYTGICLNIIVIPLFAHRLYQKTPRNSNFRRWNRPRQYEFLAFSSVLLNQIAYLCIVSGYGTYIFDGVHWNLLGDHEAFGITATVTIWTTSTCLVFASLYRYERLLTIVRSTRAHRILQILRATMLILAFLSTYAYLHNLFFDNGVIPDKWDNPYYPYLKVCHGVLDFVTLVYVGAVDLT